MTPRSFAAPAWIAAGLVSIAIWRTGGGDFTSPWKAAMCVWLALMAAGFIAGALETDLLLWKRAVRLAPAVGFLVAVFGLLTDGSEEFVGDGAAIAGYGLALAPPSILAVAVVSPIGPRWRDALAVVVGSAAFATYFVYGLDDTAASVWLPLTAFSLLLAAACLPWPRAKNGGLPA